MNNRSTKTVSWENSNKKNTRRLLLWTAAWVLSTALLAFGPRFVWEFAATPTIAAILANILVGFGMIFANRANLRGMDEMQQRIFLEASALTLGVGLVFGTAYEMLEDVKLITFEPEIPHVIILMCLTFLTGMILGNRKYR